MLTSVVDYSKRTDSQLAFTRQIFRLFTEAVGGNEYEFGKELYAKFTVEDFSFSDDMLYWGVHAYFKDVVVPHKIEVYKAGRELMKLDFMDKLKIYSDEFERNLWRHDMSKFSANESFGYAQYNRKTGYGKDGFEKAWHHHKMNNPHHPEYWFNPSRSGELEILPMPSIYIVEMVADWIGAGKTYGSTIEEWLPENIGKFLFHKDTQQKISVVLEQIGIKVKVNDGFLSVIS